MRTTNRTTRSHEGERKEQRGEGGMRGRLEGMKEWNSRIVEAFVLLPFQVGMSNDCKGGEIGSNVMNGEREMGIDTVECLSSSLLSPPIFTAFFYLASAFYPLCFNHHHHTPMFPCLAFFFCFFFRILLFPSSSTWAQLLRGLPLLPYFPLPFLSLPILFFLLFSSPPSSSPSTPPSFPLSSQWLKVLPSLCLIVLLNPTFIPSVYLMNI